MISGDPSQSLFHTGFGAVSEDRLHSSTGWRPRSSARIRRLLSRDPLYRSGYPSGSEVTVPLMMSPVTNGSYSGCPLLPFRMCTARSYAPNRTWTGPSSGSTTFGWPVHPVPHHVLVPSSSVDSEHRPPDDGNRHRISGRRGTGPSP